MTWIPHLIFLQILPIPRAKGASLEGFSCLPLTAGAWVSFFETHITKISRLYKGVTIKGERKKRQHKENASAWERGVGCIKLWQIVEGWFTQYPFPNAFSLPFSTTKAGESQFSQSAGDSHVNAVWPMLEKVTAGKNFLFQTEKTKSLGGGRSFSPPCRGWGGWGAAVTLEPRGQTSVAKDATAGHRDRRISDGIPRNSSLALYGLQKSASTKPSPPVWPTYSLVGQRFSYLQQNVFVTDTLIELSSTNCRRLITEHHPFPVSLLGAEQKNVSRKEILDHRAPHQSLPGIARDVGQFDS